MATLLPLAPHGAALDDLRNVGPKNVKAIRDITKKFLAKERGVPSEQLEIELWRGLPEEWPSQRLLSEWMTLKVFNQVLRNWSQVLGDPSRLEHYAKLASQVNFGGLTVLVDWVRMMLRFLTSPSWAFVNIVPPATASFNDNKRTFPVASSWKHVLYRVVYQDHDGVRTTEPEEDWESLVWFAPGMTAATAWFWRLDAKVIHHLLELDLIWFLRQYLRPEAVLEDKNDNLLLDGEVVAERVRLYQDAHGFFTVDRPECGNMAYKEGWQVLAEVLLQAQDGHVWPVAKVGQVYCRQAGCSLTEYNWSPPKWFELLYRAFHLVTQLEPLRSRVAAHLGIRVIETQLEAALERALARAVAAEGERRQADVDIYPTPAIANLAVTGRLGERHTPSVILVFDVANYTQLTKVLGSVEAVCRLRPFWERCWQSIKRFSPWSLAWRQGDPVAWVASQPGDGWVLVLSSDFDDDSTLDPTEAKRELVQLALELARRFHEAIAEIKDADGKPMHIRVGITWEPGLVLFQGGHNNRRVEVAANGVNEAARIQDAGKSPGLADPGGRTTLLEAELAHVLGHPERFEPAGTPHLKGLGVVTLVRCRHDVEERGDD